MARGPFDAINEAIDRLFRKGGGGDVPAGAAAGNPGGALAVAALGKLGAALPALREDLNATRKSAADETEAMVAQLETIGPQVEKEPVLQAHVEQTLAGLHVRRENLGAAGNARAHALTAAERTATELLRIAAGGKS